MSISRALDRVNAYQRRHPALGFPYAVLKRYGEDRGGWLGAVISYYGFFSLLPALLAFVTIVYWTLGSRPTLLADVLAALWATLPFVGEEARQHVAPISGRGPVLAVSLLVSIWAALSVVRVLEDACNTMWCVPVHRRPGFLPKLTRALSALGLIGAALFTTGALTVVTFGKALPAGGRAITGAVNVVVDVLLVAGLFHLLTARRLTGRDVWPGALIAGSSMYLLTLVGGLYVDRVVARASAIYGSFATVIGLLAWVTLLVQAFVVATLVNVVRVEKLWPRTMTGRDLSDGDVRAVRLTMRREAIVSEERLPDERSRGRAAGDHPSPSRSNPRQP